MSTDTKYPGLAAAALASIALALAACGGVGVGADADGNLNQSDPEVVALTFAKSFWGCGPKGARLRVKLTQPETRAVGVYLAEAKEEEAVGGCSPSPPKALRSVKISDEQDRVVVRIFGGSCNGEEMVVVRDGPLYYYGTETDNHPNGFPDSSGCT